MTSKHRITVGEELRYDGDVQGLRGLSATYVQQSTLGQASGVATLDPSGVVTQDPKVHASRHAPGGADDLGSFFARAGLWLDLRDYVQAGDGANYRPALSRALAAASTAGGAAIWVPPGTYTVLLGSSTLLLPANTTIVGVPNRTVFNLDTDSAGAYREMFRNIGDNAAVEGITFTRVSDFPMVMFPAQSFSGYRFTRCKLIGNRDIYTTNYCHGWQMGVQAGTADGLTIERCVVTKMSYGLFQANASTTTWTNTRVADCTFSNNYASDMEFNSPNGTATGVRVSRCWFSSNQVTSAGAGFAVGLAHIADAVVENCSVTGYANEAFHVEDYSQDVLIAGNTLTTCGTSQGSYVQVISGSRRVRIMNNVFEAAANANTITVVNVLAGGAGNTPGGRSVIAPSDITTSGNIFVCGATTRGVYYEAVSRGLVAHNNLSGSGGVTSGVYAGSSNWGIQIYDGRANIVSGNIIRSFLWGFFVQSSTIAAFGDGFSVTGNAVHDCQLGMGLTNAGTGTVTGNSLGNCQVPVILGSAGGTTHSVVFTGNSAWQCANPMGVYGTVQLTTTGSATVGTGKTLTVSATPNIMPNGTVITFSGGGVLTLTAQGGLLVTSLTGTVSGANIGVGETATVYLPASSDATRGRMIAFNMDEALGNGAAAMGPQGARKSVSANYTILGWEALVITTAAVTVTLPHAGRYYGPPIRIKNTAASASTVASASGTVEGSTTASLAAGSSAAYVSDGTNWLQV